MDKETVVYTYNKIVFSLKEEGNSVIMQQLEWTQRYFLCEIRQTQKEKILCNSRI